MNRMEFEVIRSRRRTLCVEIRQGRVLVRAPLRASAAEISRFLQEKRPWIEQHLARSRAQEEAKQNVPPLTDLEVRLLAREAKALIPSRVAYFARVIGVTYGRITIRCQHSRWGSCSSKGNLNFNCLLMLAPRDVLDSVIVHELCHRKYMNHSAAFYAEVLRILPDYRAQDQWLKKNGPLLMARLRSTAPPPGGSQSASDGE